MESAASKTAPVVAVKLGDAERHLKYDLNAIAEIEAATGFNLLDGKQEKIFNAKYLRALVWAGLLHEDPNLQLLDVGKMIHVGNAAEVLAKAVEAFRLSQPEAETDPSPPDPVIQ